MSEGDRLAAIRKRLEAATKGPWVHRSDHIGCEDSPVWEGVYDANGVNVEDSAANCELVAHAPEDIAYLLERVDELEGGRTANRFAIKNALARIYALEGWLRDSAEHADVCAKWVEINDIVPFQYDESVPCDCGLDALLSKGVGDD